MGALYMPPARLPTEQPVFRLENRFESEIKVFWTGRKNDVWPKTDCGTVVNRNVFAGPVPGGTGQLFFYR